MVDLPIGASQGSQFCRTITILQDGVSENLTESFMVQLASNSAFVGFNPVRSVAMVNILGESKY